MEKIIAKDICIRKNGVFHSVRNAIIYKGGRWRVFRAGCAMVKNGIMYVLGEDRSKPDVDVDEDGFEWWHTDRFMVLRRDGGGELTVQFADDSGWGEGINPGWLPLHDFSIIVLGYRFDICKGEAVARGVFCGEEGFHEAGRFVLVFSRSDHYENYNHVFSYYLTMDDVSNYRVFDNTFDLKFN